MRIFVYVMTHTGDPNGEGVWGCKKCMGGKRAWGYDAVIGVGGVAADDYDFGGRVKWIGEGPKGKEKWIASKKGPLVRFAHFVDFGTDGPILKQGAPHLQKRIQKAPRGFMGLTEQEHREAMKLLKFA